MTLRPALFPIALSLSLTCFAFSTCAAGDEPQTAQRPTETAGAVRYRTVDVRGLKIFYREAGDPSKPTILLLHGFPSSSHMYRGLLPLLADDFHLVAPDYPGAGFSDYPSAQRFTPTFDNLAGLMSGFMAQLGLKKVILYMQDFGGPVGFRLAVMNPEAIDGLIVQNANAYDEGIDPDELARMRARARHLTNEGRRQVEQLVSRDFATFLYQTGARHPGSVDPTAWNLDALILQSDEAKRIQTGLMLDYPSNLNEYPRWQSYLRSAKPKTLIVWGKNDRVFLPAGATAYQRDVPEARLRFFDTGHFALEEDARPISEEIRQAFAHP